MADYPGYGQGMSNGSGIMSVLEPFGNYLNEQIDVQRVDPFLETVSNAAYQEFGIKPDQGGGGFFSGGFYKDGGGMPHPDEGFDFSNPFPNMPQIVERSPLPAVQNPGADNTNAFSVASLSNFGPDVGNGGLFGNDGFGSVSQGPLDFPTAQIPKYEQGFDDAGLSNEPMPIMGGYTGQPMQLPYDPTPMNPLIYDSLAAAGGLPDFSGSAQSYFNPGDGGQTAYGPIPLSPDRLVQIAQGRLAQRDVKPPEVQAYLSHIVQTGGNPTMMAPPPQTNNTSLAGNLLSAGPMNITDAGNLAAFNLGTNPPPQPLTPASGPMNLVDQYGNPASFSPAQLEEMLAATPISSFQQGLQLARTQFG